MGSLADRDTQGSALLNSYTENPKEPTLFGSLLKAGGGDNRTGRAPQGAKLVEAERPHAVDLGLDRLAIGRSASHVRHAALRPDLPLRFGAVFSATMR